MRYSLLRTDKFNDQLHEIILYIAQDTGSVDRAVQYLDEMEAAVLQLRSFPDSGAVPRYTVLARQGYRVLIVRRHLLFYKVQHEKKTVILHAVVDARREYLNLV